MKKTSPVSRSGRFAGGPAAEVARFTESVSFDRRLWRWDILGSMAHAHMLNRAGLLTDKELKSIVDGLNQIATEIHAGAFPWNPELEDVHMNIEAALTRYTPAARATIRSRSTCGYGLRTKRCRSPANFTDCNRRSWTSARRTPTSSFPVTRICSARNPSFSRITCSLTSRCSRATSSG